MYKRFKEFIPKPKGLFNVYLLEEKLFMPGFVMEKLPGDKLEVVWGTLSKKAKRELEFRIYDKWDELKDAGHRSVYGWPHWNNVVYDRHGGGFGFVDFDLDFFVKRNK